jgi:RNA polymerase sigma-70 factor (ECF subfamily)
MRHVTSISEAWLAAPALTREERASAGAREERVDEAWSRAATLEALHAAHAAAIHRFLCDLLGDPASAADATQETFVRAFRRLHTLEDPSRPAPWLFGIARRVSLEQRRARRRRRQVLGEAPLEPEEERPGCGSPRSPEDELIGREALGVLRDALDRLSEDRCAALLLRLDHGMSYEDIARLLEWSLPKVKVEIHRARQVLRAALSKYEGGGR